MAGSRLYKIAHCNYRNTTRPYPLIPQVMNGTGAAPAVRPKVARHSSRAAFGFCQRQTLNDPRCRVFKDRAGPGLL
jgi:hypothetical protein